MRISMDRIVGLTTLNYNVKAESKPESIGESYEVLDYKDLVNTDTNFKCEVDLARAWYDLSVYIAEDLTFEVTPRHLLQFGNVECRATHRFSLNRERALLLLKSIEAFLDIETFVDRRVIANQRIKNGG